MSRSLTQQLRRLELFLIALSSLTSLAFLFVVIPVASLFISCNVHVLLQLFTSPEYAYEVRSAFVTTFVASGIATLILLLVGVPAGYVLARYSFPGKPLVESILDVPLLMPHVVSGIMILSAFGRRGILSPLVSLLGVRVEDSLLGVVLAMMYVSAPIMIDTVKAAVASIDPMLEHVARTLGASRTRTFFSVTLPLISRSIVAASILTWARALSEVGAILIVAYYPKTVNILVLEYFQAFGLKYAIALAVPLALISIAIFSAIRIILRS